MNDHQTTAAAENSAEPHFSIERRLAELSPKLHRQYKDCVAVSWQMLSSYGKYFPNFTDHTILHSLDVLDWCNQLIGDQLNGLIAEDLYVLMMGALFHDVGMGVTPTDFDEFRPKLGLPLPVDDGDKADMIRDYHQEFSGLFVKKYWGILELPGPQCAQALIQVCRGHRKTDLMDLEGYPAQFTVEPGRPVYLPYLAALLCLADELDISRDRNIQFLYNIESVRTEKSRMEFRKHMAIEKVVLKPDRAVVCAWSDRADVRDGVQEECDKLRGKLLMCRKVAQERSPFEIRQKDVELILDPIYGPKEEMQ